MTARAPARSRLAAPDQATIVKAVLFVIVVGLVIGPLVILVRASLAPPGTLPLETSTLTLESFRRIFAAADTLQLLLNTAVYAAGSVVLGVGGATALAWLTERTDLPGRSLVRILLFSWMAVPPLVIGFGWILLINPGQGALNVLARSLLGLSRPPFTLYSFWSLIVITAFSVLPTAFVMVAGLLRNMDPQLESAGRVLGGGAVTVARRITLPLLTPGILSVGIYMVMAVVQAFELPFIVGLTARFPVLSTRVYLLASPTTGIPEYGLSAAFGVFLLMLALGLMWGYYRAVGAGERFHVVTGRAFRPRRIALGRWRPAAAAAVAALFATMSLPLAILLWTSLFPSYRLPSLEALSEASLATYARVIEMPFIRQAVGNTLVLVLGSSTAVMLIGALVAWFSVRQKGAVARIMDVVSFAPTAVPPVVMVMAILLLYLGTPIYGTVLILIVGHVTIYLAFATRTMTGALAQLHKELGDAALVAGASWWTAFRRVTLPLVRPQLLNGWLWVLAHSARDLTIPLVLMTSSNVVVASAIWMMWDFPDLSGAAAMSVLLVLGLLAVVIPMQLVAGRDVGGRE